MHCQEKYQHPLKNSVLAALWRLEKMAGYVATALCALISIISSLRHKGKTAAPDHQRLSGSNCHRKQLVIKVL